MAAPAAEDRVKNLSDIKRRKWLKPLFGISIGATAVFVLLHCAYILDNDIRLFFVKAFKCWRISATGIKDVAMTVGLTGVIFTWLLQIMESEECGQPMSRLIERLVKRYKEQIGLFIIDVVVCIYCADAAAADAASLFALLVLFLSVVSGICFMWVLCTLLLFSKQTRREIAFACLKADIDGGDAKTADAARRCWRQEIPACLSGHEDLYVHYYFASLLRTVNNSGIEAWRRAVYVSLTDIAERVDPLLLQRLPAYMRTACEGNEEGYCDLLSVYTVILAELFARREPQYDAWGGELYSFVWYFLREAAQNAGQTDSVSIYLYAAFYIFYSNYMKDLQAEDMDGQFPERQLRPYAGRYRGPAAEKLRDRAYQNMVELLCLTNHTTITSRERNGWQMKYNNLLG